ncbi:MAG: hypothetical protein K2W95_25100 [Candidatus Obscuribacterales bacterium]|nr:hypothetical protein [Candidatus Obscuribacterales bacterium]
MGENLYEFNAKPVSKGDGGPDSAESEQEQGSTLDEFRAAPSPDSETSAIKVAGADTHTDTLVQNGFADNAYLLAQLFGDSNQTDAAKAKAVDTPRTTGQQGDLIIVLPQNALEALQKKLPLNEQGDRRYTEGALQMSKAERLIAELPIERREEWNNFQEKLSQATTAAEAEAVRKERNGQFPDIAQHVEIAKQLVQEGDELHRLKQQEDQAKKMPEGGSLLDMLRRGRFPGGQPSENGLPRLNIPSLNARTPSGQEGELALTSPFTSKQDALLKQLFKQPFPGLEGIGRAEYNLMRGLTDSKFNDIENPNPVKVQGDKLVNDLRARGVPAADLERFGKDLEQFLERREVTDEQKAETLNQVARLLTTESRVGVTEQQRIRLAEQIINQTADIRSIDQGPYLTCNVTTVEKVLSARQPEQVARTITDLALTGSTKTESGSTVTLDATSLQPASADAIAYPDAENVRTHASQLFQLAAIQQKWDTFNKANGTDLRYTNAGGVQGDAGDYLMDYSQTPPAKVYGIENGKPVLQATEEKDAKGNLILDENLQPVMKKPIQDPGFNIVDALNSVEQFSGKPADGMGLMHYSKMPIGGSNGFYNGLKLIYSATGFNADCADPRIKGFRNPDQLKELLEAARKEQRFPIILEVHTGSGFLREQVVEANGGAGGAGDADVGGGHVVTINDYDPRTGKVDVDNQWGNSRDRVGTKGATLAEVDQIAAVAPEVAQRQAKQDQKAQELRQEYTEWARSMGIEPFTRYPTKTELERFRNK